MQKIENKKNNTISKLLTSRLLWVTILINILVVLMISITINTIMNEVETNHLTEVVNNLTNSVNNTIEKYIQFADVIAKNTAIIQLLKESDLDNPMHKNVNKDVVINELQFIAQNFEKEIVNFGVLDIEQDGYLTHRGDYSDSSYSFKERSYYCVVETLSPYVTAPYIDDVTKNLIMSVVTPIIDNNGEVLGAVNIDLNTNFLADIITVNRYGTTGSGIIIDNSDTILAHENNDFVGKDMSYLNISTPVLLDELISPTKSIFNYSINEIEKIGIMGEIKDYGWRILAYMNYSEFKLYNNLILYILILLQFMSTAVTVYIASKTVKYSLEPITEIKHAMQELANGNTNFELEYKSNDEIGDLADNVRFAGENLSAYIYKIEFQLDYDDLTLLYTPHKFINDTKELVLNNLNETYSIMVCDIDNFKYINDTFGYQKGTQILKEFGLFFNSVATKGTPFARSNADVFMFLFDSAELKRFEAEHDEIHKILSERISAIINEHYDLSLSIGIYTIDNPNLTVSSMIDCAMYAKNTGKSSIGVSIKYYGDFMNDERTANNYVVSKMREGAKKKEFVIYYQPKVNLSTNKIAGAEALVRWFSDGELITPNKFIPVFETNGFIETLDYYTIDATCKFIKENEDKNLPIISINLSGVTLMKKDVVSKVLAIVETYDLKPSNIELEITESAFVNSFDSAMEKINQFRRLDFSISMDDFGCGVSSLGRLKDMPIDVIKIDRDFIVDSFKNNKADLILKNIVQMSKDLKLKTVVEGIETIDQLKIITELGCDLGQGYIFSRPVPGEDFLTMLDNYKLQELDDINAEFYSEVD